ncbi:MAG: hypothetical protein IT158_25030 [Bryobacterales bacterium]|nr:hypothetical protein [Bryobacterales bacterium]
MEKRRVTRISVSRDRRRKREKRPEGWRLASGRRLFEFVLRGGFLATALLKKEPGGVR